MAEASADINMQIREITQCSICTETYTDPKELPCVHTFCLKCLEGWGGEKQPDDKVSCPMCRKEFKVPDGGFKNLPKNIFVAKLLEINLVSKTNKGVSNYCDACSDVKEIKEIALMFCINCEQYLCNVCGNSHTKLKFAKSHTVVSIESGLPHRDLMKMSNSFCNQHQDEAFKLYCFDCKTVICMMCFVEDHQTHKCSNVDKVAEEFHTRMADDVFKVEGKIAEVWKKKNLLENIKKEHMNRINSVEADIINRGEYLKSIIDSETRSLLKMLVNIRDEKLKEIEVTKNDLEREIVILESFKKYCKELREKANACDIARIADGLHTRAMELRESNSQKVIGIDVTFIETDLQDILKSDNSNFVGKIGFVSSVYTDDPQLVYSTRADSKRVCGVTCLGDEVFVVRDGEAEVEVYDVRLSLKRRIGVTGLTDPWDVASCAKDSCLYICDCSGKRVYRMELTGNTRNWKVQAEPQSLSVTPKSNIIVTMYRSSTLNEFTANGHLVREINLKPNVNALNLLHAVQLASGQLLVSHGFYSGLQEVCSINDDGRVVRSYGGPAGSSTGQLNYPYHLFVDKQGFILVADSDNNRVVLLNSSPTFVKELISANNELKGPRKLFLNESRGILYVGEYNCKQVLAFRVKDIQKI